MDADTAARLLPGRESAVALVETELQRLPPTEPDRGFALLHVTEALERQRAIRDEVQRGVVYQDDFSFGTEDARWFEARSIEMVRFHACGVWAIVLLDDGRYPALVRARNDKTAAATRIARTREAIQRRMAADPDPQALRTLQGR